MSFDPEPSPYICSPLLKAVAPDHGFTTRQGGVSAPPFDSLNLGFNQGDADEHVEANLGILSRAAGLEGRAWALCRQVHSACVLRVSEGDDAAEGCVTSPAQGAMETVGEGDALITDLPAVVVAVRIADCTPILLSSADGRVVAAVHAGWRGTAAGIVMKTCEAFSAHYGVPAQRLRAAIGPAIGVDHYEVGPEVATAVAGALDLNPEAAPAFCHRGREDRWQVDLAEANRQQLLRAGMAAAHIDAMGLDTYGDAARFFSHRRDDGRTGRLLTFIAPRVPLHG